MPRDNFGNNSKFNSGIGNKPFGNLNKLSGLDNFSPILDNDKIGEVDFFDNTHAPGFVKDFQGPTKYIEDSSDKDLYGNMKFTKLNKYEDSINSNPDGYFSQVQVDNSHKSSNPLLENHLSDIGLMGDSVSQEVDFFSGDNSYFSTLNPAIVGFSQMFTSGDGSLLITGGTDSNLDNLLSYRINNLSQTNDDGSETPLYENYKYDPRTPRLGVPVFTGWGLNKNIYFGSALDNLSNNVNTDDNTYLNVNSQFVSNDGEDLFNSRKYDFREERSILNDLPGPLGAGGQKIVKFYNAPNSYDGSTLDNLLSMQISPFAGGFEDYTLLSQYIGDISGAPYINLDDYHVDTLGSNVGTGVMNDGNPVSHYDDYNYDPRTRDRQALYNLAHGQPMIKFYNPQNPYKGSKFDDPLVEGVWGGGAFNNGENKLYSNDEFRGTPFPSMKEIAESGNFGNSVPGESNAITSFVSSLDGINRYVITSGVSFPLTEIGSDVAHYYDGSPFPGEGSDDDEFPSGGHNFESINLGNSSWWYGGSNDISGIPLTNMYVEGSLTDLSINSGTRTVSISGDPLTSGRLGFGDLIFDTIYTSDSTNGSTGRYDDRLNMRYTTLGGPAPLGSTRGNEPYIVTPIPDDDESERTDSFLFDTGGIGGTENGTYLVAREDRVATDKKRFEEYFKTQHGSIFLKKHIFNFTKNPRSYRGFVGNGEFNGSAIEKSLSGGMGYYSNVKNLIELDIYTGTVYESLLRPFGLNLPGEISHPGEAANDALFITNNLRNAGLDIPYLGGIAFQALGLNKLGFTDKTNVAPTSLETLIWDNISNAVIFAIGETPIFGKSVLQTPAGGMSEFTNPRFLGYTQKIDKPENELHRLSHLVPRRFNKSSTTRLLKGNENIDSSLTPLKLLDYNEIPHDSDSRVDIVQNIFDFFGKSDGTYETKVGTNVKHPLSMDPQNEKTLGIDIENSKTKLNPFGDFMTMLPIKKSKFLQNAYREVHKDIESETNGFPFYFKDLRDNSYIFFRGYIYGLTEQITPRWNEEVFIGRSEPVFNYEVTTRDITFTLKIAANSRYELDMIYDKLDRLASLCYPEYKDDKINFIGGSVTDGKGKVRPKPPLTKFRVAELFGRKDNELSGFIKSLSNVYPDTNQWETEKNHRVPLYVESNMTYQVIHETIPEYSTKFYGKGDNYHKDDGPSYYHLFPMNE